MENVTVILIVLVMLVTMGINVEMMYAILSRAGEMSTVSRVL